MAKQVFHAEPRLSVGGGLERHNSRETWLVADEVKKLIPWSPPNADQEKTKDCEELIDRVVDGRKLSVQQLVERRIKEAGLKARKTSHTSLELILSGSPERMNAMSADELHEWAADMMAWTRASFGAENVVSAFFHVDEKTPHIHAFVVPIVKGPSRRSAYDRDNRLRKRFKEPDPNQVRLCASDMLDRRFLRECHDSLAVINQKYGLERGEVVDEDNRKVHTEKAEYNRQLKSESIALQKQLQEEKKKLLSMEKRLQAMQNEQSVLQGENRRLSAELAQLNEEKRAGQRQVSNLHQEKNARIEQLRQTIKAGPKPERGILGYKTESVDNYIKAAEAKELIKTLSADPIDYKKRYLELQNEVELLRKDMNNPDSLRSRLWMLENEKSVQVMEAQLCFLMDADVQVRNVFPTSVKGRNGESLEAYRIQASARGKEVEVLKSASCSQYKIGKQLLYAPDSMIHSFHRVNISLNQAGQAGKIYGMERIAGKEERFLLRQNGRAKSESMVVDLSRNTLTLDGRTQAISGNLLSLLKRMATPAQASGDIITGKKDEDEILEEIRLGLR